MVALYPMLRPAGEVWTADDLANLDPTDPTHYEIMDGNLIVTPPAADIHRASEFDLAYALQRQAPPRWRVVPELGLALVSGNVEPDIVVVRPGFQLTGELYAPPGEVALVVEVLSTSSTARYDRGRKSEAYSEAGIGIYWLFDPDTGELEVRTLRGDRYITEGIYTDSYTTKDPYEIVLDLAEITPSVRGR